MRTLVLVLGLAAAAHAHPLRLDYFVQDLGGDTYDYSFTLTLDDHDGSWEPGMGWSWVVFGDVPWPERSPLEGFDGDEGDFPVGPWTFFNYTSGGHNGPSMGDIYDFWYPTVRGEKLHWSGTHTAHVPDLQWSMLWADGGAERIEFGRGYQRGEGCDLEVRAEGAPAFVRRGSTLTFEAVADNVCNEDLTVDRANLVVTGPASLTRTLYDGAPLVVAAGGTLSATVRLYAPPTAPLGSYSITLTAYRNSGPVDDDTFVVDVVE